MVELVDGVLIVGDEVATAIGGGCTGVRTSADQGGILAGARGVTGSSVLALEGALGKSGGKIFAGAEAVSDTFSGSTFTVCPITGCVAGAGA
jgi:hypothetical protein